MDHPLTQEELHEAVEILPGWELAEGRLVANFQFKNFVQAFSFMTAIALEAEKMNHHPDWSNSYNKVSISLFTHDSKSITDKDILLARKIQQLAHQLPSYPPPYFPVLNVLRFIIHNLFQFFCPIGQKNIPSVKLRDL